MNMPHKIFLSHNHHDKPLVEAVAIRLGDIFGRDQVFYDSWSIRPGDGIIDQMNKGLEAPEFIFFFVSANSLKSEMVKLEWQNAVFAATKGKTRLIPVRVDGSPMPPILLQTLYIDMHTVGLEAAIAQIVGVTQGNASFVPKHQTFSNLSYSATIHADGTVNIVIKASHLMEPNPNFMLLVENDEAQISWTAPNAPGFYGGFTPGVSLENGTKFNGVTMRPMNATLTPNYPVRLQIMPNGADAVRFIGVLHQMSEHNWVSVPLA
jgi:TIR domain